MFLRSGGALWLSKGYVSLPNSPVGGLRILLSCIGEISQCWFAFKATFLVRWSVLSIRITVWSFPSFLLATCCFSSSRVCSLGSVENGSISQACIVHISNGNFKGKEVGSVSFHSISCSRTQLPSFSSHASKWNTQQFQMLRLVPPPCPMFHNRPVTLQLLC